MRGSLLGSFHPLSTGKQSRQDGDGSCGCAAVGNVRGGAGWPVGEAPHPLRGWKLRGYLLLCAAEALQLRESAEKGRYLPIGALSSGGWRQAKTPPSPWLRGEFLTGLFSKVINTVDYWGFVMPSLTKRWQISSSYRCIYSRRLPCSWSKIPRLYTRHLSQRRRSSLVAPTRRPDLLKRIQCSSTNPLVFEVPQDSSVGTAFFPGLSHKMCYVQCLAPAQH